MRLDEADPVTAWRDRTAELAARGRALNALDLAEVHYRSAGTDLTVGLLPDSRWTGGPAHRDGWGAGRRTIEVASTTR